MKVYRFLYNRRFEYSITQLSTKAFTADFPHFIKVFFCRRRDSINFWCSIEITLEHYFQIHNIVALRLINVSSVLRLKAQICLGWLSSWSISDQEFPNEIYGNSFACRSFLDWNKIGLELFLICSLYGECIDWIHFKLQHQQISFQQTSAASTK